MRPALPSPAIIPHFSKRRLCSASFSGQQFSVVLNSFSHDMPPLDQLTVGSPEQLPALTTCTPALGLHPCPSPSVPLRPPARRPSLLCTQSARAPQHTWKTPEADLPLRPRQISAAGADSSHSPAGFLLSRQASPFVKVTPAPRPLHLLFSVPAMAPGLMVAWLALHSGPCFSVTSSERPSLTVF